MKILSAIDSMKGSLTSAECNQIIKNVGAEYGFEVTSLPVADGGDGFLDAFLLNKRGERKRAAVKGLYGDVLEAEYGVIPEERLAILEVAKIVGIDQLDDHQSIFQTTSYGIGQLIRIILSAGNVSEITVGLGGTANIDGGYGMLNALGYRFYDAEGLQLSYFAKDMEKIASFKKEDFLIDLKLTIASDVTNPLLGENGATYIYGEQKGIWPDQFGVWDNTLQNYQHVLLGSLQEHEYDGAAGGLGFGMRVLGGDFFSGYALLDEKLGIEEKISASDLVITGEGKLDAQTLNGKLPIRLAGHAKALGKKVAVFSGMVEDDYETLHQMGFDVIVPIIKEPQSIEEAIVNAERNLTFAANSFFSSLCIV